MRPLKNGEAKPQSVAGGDDNSMGYPTHDSYFASRSVPGHLLCTGLSVPDARPGKRTHWRTKHRRNPRNDKEWGQDEAFIQDLIFQFPDFQP